MFFANKWVKFSATVFIGLFIILAGAQGARSEYVNPALPDKGTAPYWLDQGGFFCTYGNFKAALRAYEKALEIEPNNSETLFDMGVAYAEMGDYEKALSAMDRAIGLSSNSGRFYYGRAWVHLRSGLSAKALPDFEKAAGLGSLDASNYLQGQDK